MEDLNVTIASALENIFASTDSLATVPPDVNSIATDTMTTMTTAVSTMAADTSLMSLTSLTPMTSFSSTTPSPRMPRSMRSRSNSGTSKSGRRRFISRADAVDAPEPELPVVYHSPQVSKVYPPTATTTAPTTSRLQKSATIDYAPTAASKGVKDVPRARSGSTEGATSRSTAFGRSNTSDSAWGHDASRWGQKNAPHTSEGSCDTVTSPLTPRGARSDPYPQTYPGSRTSQDRERSVELSDGSSCKVASQRPRPMGRRADSSPRSAARIEELPEPMEATDPAVSPTQQRGATRLTRGSSTESASSSRQHATEETSKGSILGRRKEKRARALAMEAAQQGVRPRVPVGLEHVSPHTLKPPDSPLVQHAPRKAQPFLGRSQTIDVATISQPTKDIVPPSPVPPWRSKELTKDKSKADKEKQKADKVKEKERHKVAEKERVTSPMWDGPLSPKSSDKNSKSSSQRILSPTALLVASSSRLMSPVAMPSSSSREASVKSPTSPPPLVPLSEKDSTPSLPDEAKARADRIALYKEQRRKELANLYSPPGQDARGKNSADTNLENFMKHAKKYGLDKSTEEKAVEERKTGTAPLVATVAPMVTSMVTSPITSTATVSSPTTTSDSKGSAVVTLSKSSDTKPVATSSPRLTSPSTLTATRVIPTQSLTSLSPTKPVSPLQSHTSPKVISPPSLKSSVIPEDHHKGNASQKAKVASPVSQKLTSPIAQHKVTSPVMTQKITSPVMTQKVTSPIKDSVKSSQKADPSVMTQKITSPIKDNIKSPQKADPSVMTQKITSPIKDSVKSLEKADSSLMTQKVASPIKDNIKSPQKADSSSSVLSPQYARKAFFAEFAEFDKDLPSPKPSPSFIPKVNKPAVTSSAVTSPVTSPVMSQKSMTSSDRTASTPLSPNLPTKSKLKSPSKVLSPGAQLPVTVKIKEPDTSVRTVVKPASPPPVCLCNQSPTTSVISTMTASTTKTVTESTKSPGETRTSISVNDLLKSGRSKLHGDVSVEKSVVDSRDSQGQALQTSATIKSPASAKQARDPEPHNITDGVDKVRPVFSKMKQKDEVLQSTTETTKTVAAEVLANKLEPKQSKQKQRPVHLHIEETVLPEVILKPKQPPLAEPEDLGTGESETIPENSFMKDDEPLEDMSVSVSPPLEVDMAELEAEVRLMEQILFSDGPIESPATIKSLVTPSSSSRTDSMPTVVGPSGPIEKDILESTPKTPTTPVSHADLYEQAIANKKLAAEEENRRREEEAAAEVELKRALRMAGVHKSEQKIEAQTVFHHAVVAQAVVPHTALPQAVLPQAALPQATVPQAAVSQAAVMQTVVTQTALPKAAVPQAAVSQAAVPQATVPQAAVPQTAVPQAEVPQAALPQPEMPQAAVPQTSLPQAALPQAILVQAIFPQAAMPQAAVSQAISPPVMAAEIASPSPPAQFLTSPKMNETVNTTVVTSSVSSSASKTPTTPVTPEKVLAKGVHMRKVEEGPHHKKRLKELQREDSFNRADSPIREPMPLPKDSVIARHRQSRSRHRVRQDSSSSESGTSPPRSPRTSPRSPKKPKGKGGFTGGRDSTRLGVEFVAEEKERGRSGRPERHRGDVLTSGAVSVTSGFHPHLPVSSCVTTASPTSPPSRVPADQSASSYVMGQNATKPSPDGAPGSVAGSLAASDSSNSTSSRRERKRFKKRDVEDDAVPATEVKVRPGKKDKSSIRKSALNTAIDEEEPSDTRRTSDARRSSPASEDVIDTGSQRPQVGGRKRDDPLTASEIRLASQEVFNALKARREEVDNANDVTDGLRAEDNQNVPLKAQPTSHPATILKRPEVKHTPMQITSILTSSRENTADVNKPIHTTSILKKESHLDNSEWKPVSILKSTDSASGDNKLDNKLTPITTTPSSFKSALKSPRSPTPPATPTHQSSTFIMVTSSNRKPADPHVELTSGGARVTSPKGHAPLQRSETLREGSESLKENKEPERRPLKPILRKAKTVDVSVWDPELENVLKQRRERPEGDSESGSTDRTAEPADAEEEEKGDEPKLSIAERIFRMETKIEESKFSKSYAGSGATTPRVLKLRTAVSGPASPTPRASDPSPLTPDHLEENEALFAKLADVAVVRDAADRRREKCQQRKDDDWRTRTTPVTQSELNEADRLESELKDIPEMGVIHNEPTPTLSRKKMVRKKVEAARAAFFEDSDSDFDKLVELNKRRAQGVLSPDMPVEEVKEEVQDDLSKMSVSQKMALFRKMEDEEKEKKSIGSKRFADRRNKRMERSRTQPITEEEIGQAAVIAKEQKAEQENQMQQEQEAQGQEEESRPVSSMSMENLNGPDGDGVKDDSTTEDDLSKLSLAEKMKLFSQEQEEKNASTPKRDTPVTRRKTRRLQSRFKTQSANTLPVTTEEVEKAAQHRISPLALSLVKPPDPEVLGTMSLKDQKDFMARWAMETLQQLGSRPTSGSGSRPVSRGPASDEEEEKESPASTAKDKSSPSVRGILKPEQKAELERELRGILRAAGAPYPLEATLNMTPRSTEVKQQPPPIHGILKKDTTPNQEPQVTTSILKKDSAFEPKLPVPGMLKKDMAEPVVLKAEPERSALKKDSTFEPRITEPGKSAIRMDHGVKEGSTVEDNSSTKGILRKDIGVNHATTEVKSALKVTAAQEVSLDNQNEALKRGILKTRTMDVAEIQAGILRSPPPPTVVSHKAVEVSRPSDLDVASRSIQDQGQVQSQSSTEESESSGGTRRIKNEAVARRRHHRELRKQGERCHTQPIEGGWADGSQSSSLEGQHGVHQRHHTQPITSQEKEEAESGKVKDGIASRLELTEDELALLQRSGEEDWKRRVLKKENTVDCGEVVKMREKKGDKKERPTSIADRLSLLQGSQDSWRDRIEETDVKQFTVAGKLELQGKAMTPDSPLLTRRRKPKVPLARALSTPTMYMELGSDDDAKKDADEGPITVDVPHAAEGVDEFFQSRTVEELSKDKHDVSVDDFDHIFLASQDILPSVQKARPQTRRAASSRNPLKTLAQRRDIQTQYIQVQSGVADREMRRIKRDQIAGSACFATEALAGLAATENFANVMLRKTDLFTSGTPGNQKLEPYSEVMLLQVKGRRHCQTRLVAPDASSLNSGDCFILVTPERCWVWVGDFSNVIEKAKAIEVAGVIQAKRDLGCKSPYEPTVMEESAATIVKRFWEVLGGEADYQDVGPAEEDEVYEADMAETVRVYRLAGEQFVLWEEVSGCVPRYEMLNTKDILIFDFGSEFYLWTGKQAAFSKRKVALKLARDMWATGYDYTSHGFNPMSPLASESQGGLPLKDAERPDWTLFGKVNQNMETVLFREKFFDWPDASRLITVKGQDDVEPKTDGNIELMAYDVAKMIPIDTSPVTMVLEGSHVGRGNIWTELYEGLRREYEITTLATKVWHVNEYQVMDLDDVSYGQFHDGDTYVVRWQYMIMQTGMKTLKGASARHSLVGRERCAYFFWQGRHSSVNEKGASALMTVELDEERGPQVRVLQDKEQPCFLNLFKSKMVVHIGKREAEDTCTQGSWRLYVIRNELSGEAHLTEVTCSLTSFRSRGVFVLIHITTGQILLWNGAKSGNNTRQRALEIAQNLKTACPAEMGIKEGTKLVMTKMDEGYETQEFWEAMEFQDASAYVSLLDDVRPWTHTPRLFLMSSVSGEFRATEVVNPCRSGETVAPFPFLQADLYTAPQPAQLMIDNHHEVFLWQGWWPEGTEEEENISTGSAVARFNTDRCCAMETVLNYCQAKTSGSPSPAFVVYAGLEPKAFTNLFPYWEQNEEAAVANSKEGKKAGLRIPVKEVLKKLTSTRYTYDELQERPLPDGVDPMRIEAYLLDDEFQRVLGMTKEEFYERPTWKQSDMKKEFSLF